MTLPSTRTLLLSSVTVASLYVVHSRIIASFGSYGRLGMFVWEGDSLTAEERAASDALNEAEKKLKLRESLSTSRARARRKGKAVGDGLLVEDVHAAPEAEIPPNSD